jgi:hypothetical protein
LNGPWEFRRDGDPSWKSVRLPATFQSHEGTDFHGIGWYRKTLAPFRLPKGQRALLHLQAAATLTEAWWNGEKVGSHLGGWTPFRFDVTEQVRKHPASKEHEILLRVDEKAGHNTQGFLPIIEPHFGGIWQEVRLLIVPDSFIDDLRLQALGNPDTGRVELDFPLAGSAQPSRLEVAYRLRGEGAWATTTIAPQPSSTGSPATEKTLHASFAIPDPRPWSCEKPSLYELTIRLQPQAPGQAGDEVTTRVAFRQIAASGSRLVLNGHPLSVRGLLNWGYYPPLLAPQVDEQRSRADLELARSLGFNLMKFCLWVPPKRFLELADEMGVLAWMEYPTWHPQLDEQHLPELTREFAEFFAYDRNHPSVVLRSLTCETGPGADLRVIRGLYDLAHRSIPGSLVEDDSSWIAWNRITDFFDDHPYGNNHTWVPTLRRLREHARTHGPKPLVLGEAIAADTWTLREPLLARVGTARPYWLPGFFEGNDRWLNQVRAAAGPGGLDHLASESRRYALLMRQYQAETFRREVPDGGYVISVIRDFPLAAMGLLDYLDRPKWSAHDWQWQRDTVCLLQTESDRRTFAAGEPFRAEALVSHFGTSPLTDGQLTLVAKQSDGSDRELGRLTQTDLIQKPGTLAKVADWSFALPVVTQPTRFHVQARLTGAAGTLENEWPYWIVPRADAASRPTVGRHASLAATQAKDFFPGAMDWPGASDPEVVVASRFDLHLLDFLARGGRVLLLPDGKVNSFPLADHWFLRGGPYLSGHPLLRIIPRELFVETQHFDLVGRVVPEVKYLEQIDPILMLWDNHDIKEVRTHGLLFEARVGRGRLVVSALRHGGPTNAVGRWLLDVLLKHLRTGPEPTHSLAADTRQQLREKLLGRPGGSILR